MKAWKMLTTGAPDVLSRADIDTPLAGPGQVLLRVVAAGFNPIDTKIRAGVAAIAPETGVLGCDVSGVVEAVGEGVSRFRPGDAVFGCAGGVKGSSGALAEFMVADEQLLALAPASVPLAHCAALPVAALTARALMQRLAIGAGDRVFVVGASGAVGQMVTQMALAVGASVTGSAGSASRLEQVRQYGADACLHSDIPAIVERGERFARVIDTFGTTGLQSALALADVYGQVATINARGQHELALAHAKSLTLHAIFVLLPLLNGHQRDSMGQALSAVAQDIDAGILRLMPLQISGMAAVADIHRRYEAGTLADKVVMLADF